MAPPSSIDFVSPISPNIFVYKLLGIWLPKANHKYYTFALAKAATIWLMQLCFLFTQLVYFINNISDVEAATATSYILVTILCNMVKVITSMRNIKIIKSIIREMNHPIFAPLNENQKKIAKEGNILSVKLFRFLVKYCSLLSILWGIAPLLSDEKKLPFRAWFPFDVLASPWYEIIYVFQLVIVSYNSTIGIIHDTLAVRLLAFIGIQCDNLCDSLENLHDFGEANMDEMLKHCVEHHKRILEFRRQTEKLYCVSVVFQFTTSTFVICSTLLQMKTVEFVSTEFLMLVVYQVVMVLQLFLYCWFGNEVIVKSCKIPIAAYNMNWLERDTSFKKKLVFFIRRSQHHMNLLVGGIFIISLEIFIKILRSSFSYFTVLNSFNN